MILIEDVSYQIAGKTILKPTTLQLPRGGMTALIGPNGAGKSTLLNVIARILPLQTGRVCFDSCDIAHTESHQLAQKVALLQQQVHFMSRLTVEDLLTFARYPYHRGRVRSEDRAKVSEMLSYFDLQDFRHRYLDELSGGQRQRALVAMTFTQDTDYILLDEPLNNLDIHHAKALMLNLKNAVLEWGKTIVVVLHDINYAAHYADHIVAMQQGEVLHYGITEDIINQEILSALYHLDIELLPYRDKKLCVYF
ncbi:MAG: ATP-binding cassette domain-containing protein [Cardiobacteriaceae bacterium]|nr:ATP-binding cassette domain-containing protein [Cardiobacteriaceae bacterium]